MKLTTAFVVILLTTLAAQNVLSRHLQRQRKGAVRHCVSKFYNRELGPLEILMLPLGEKLWLRAWLGNHMTNLLHMEGVDLAEVTQLATEQNRTRRSFSGSDNAVYSSRLPRHVMPSSYRLMLQPSIRLGVYQGRVQINVTCLQATDTVVLHAHKDLKVSRAAISVRRVGRLASASSSFESDNRYDRFSGNFLLVKKVVRDLKTSHCEIVLSEPLVKGATYQLDIPFSGQLSSDKQQAFYFNNPDSNSTDMRWFIASRMKHSNARRVFPCFDEAHFKATFEISITRPIEMKAISTMPVRASDTQAADDDGWTWDHFQITPPMSPSSLVILIFNPRNFFPVSPSVTQGGVKVQGFAEAADLSRAQTVVNYLTVGITHLERYLGVAFPLPQLNVIFPPDSSVPADSSWGLLVAGSNFEASVHLLQQWFGHLVTPEDEVSENLTLGLAHYHALICPMEVTDKCESSDGPAQGLQYMYTSQYDASDKPTPQQFQLRKTIWLFRMLNYSLTERTFRRGIQNFLKTKAYSTFHDDDLWDELDMQAWTYATLEREVSTRDVAHSWTSRDYYPVVTVTRNYKDNTASFVQEVFIRRWPYKLPGKDNLLWWVPLMFLSQEDLDLHNISFITWMRGEREVTIQDLPGADSFIIVNPEDIGMFIVNYDLTNWRMLATYLTTSGAGDGRPLIPTATRAKLLHNAWYLALGGRLDLVTALNMTLFLRTETEVPVWKALAQVYFAASWKLTGTQAEIKYDRFMGDLMIHMYIKDEEENLQEYEDMAEIHALARYVLCKAGHKEAIKRARAEFARWLDDQKEISDGTLWGVFRWVDEDWERGLQRVLSLLHNTTSSGFRGFLLSQLVSSTIQPRKVERVLEILLLDENYKFPEEEIKEVTAAVADPKTFLQFLNTHWIAIKNRFKSQVGAWQHILEQATRKFKTQEGYNMVLDFYAAHKHEDNIPKIMEHSLQVIRMSKEGIYKNLTDLESWMRKYIKQSKYGHLFYSTEVAIGAVANS